MIPTGPTRQLDSVAEMRRQCARQHLLPLQMASAHPDNMPVVLAALHQPYNQLLEDRGRSAISKPLEVRECTHQRFWHHKIGKPQCGGQRLCKAGAVDDALGRGIERCECLERATLVEHLAVVVVLQDHAARASRPIQQCLAPPH